MKIFLSTVGERSVFSDRLSFSDLWKISFLVVAFIIKTVATGLELLLFSYNTLGSFF